MGTGSTDSGASQPWQCHTASPSIQPWVAHSAMQRSQMGLIPHSLQGWGWDKQDMSPSPRTKGPHLHVPRVPISMCQGSPTYLPGVPISMCQESPPPCAKGPHLHVPRVPISVCQGSPSPCARGPHPYLPGVPPSVCQGSPSPRTKDTTATSGPSAAGAFVLGPPWLFLPANLYAHPPPNNTTPTSLRDAGLWAAGTAPSANLLSFKSFSPQNVNSGLKTRRLERRPRSRAARPC